MNYNPFNMNGKEVLITGGLGQIGQVAAISILKFGGSVILWDINEEKLPEFLERCRGYEKKIKFNSVDITKSNEVEATLNRNFEESPRLDTLLHLAAIDAKFEEEGEDNLSAFHKFPEKKWLESVSVNINGTFLVTKYFINKLLEDRKKGNIILTSSIYSFVSPNQKLYLKEGEKKNKEYKPVDYVATKSIIPNYTRYLATMYAQDGVRVNSFAPHGVYNLHNEGFKDRFSSLSPIGRMCNKDELVGPIIFLASEASSYMNGSSLVIDGGWTAW